MPQAGRFRPAPPLLLSRRHQTLFGRLLSLKRVLQALDFFRAKEAALKIVNACRREIIRKTGLMEFKTVSRWKEAALPEMAEADGFRQTDGFSQAVPSDSDEGLPATPSRLSVLIVDDNRDFCYSLFDFFEALGFEVSGTHDPKTALYLLERNGGFDVAIVDLFMPELPGLELLQEARKHHPDLKGILVTGCRIDSRLVSRARKAGCVKIFSKPVEYPVLLKAIQKLNATGQPGPDPEGEGEPSDDPAAERQLNGCVSTNGSNASGWGADRRKSPRPR